MNSSVSNTHVLYSVKTAAWLLGVPQSEVARAVRRGLLTSVITRGARLIPAYALIRLLDTPEAGLSDRAGPSRAGQGGGDA